jgi:pyruvate-ferredoxin/flavodoxin oxidoreductase
MGCGEKTAVHLVTAAAEAAAQPRVARFVTRLDELIAGLASKQAQLAEGDDRHRRVERLRAALEELHWRYVAGPTGRGRAALAIANSTGCSSVWGSTYPYNPYPYPWTNHLFQDAPSIGIGLFEGLMRKMADAFAAVRKAELELADGYQPARHDAFFTAFDWQQFSDDEHRLCPPLLVVGGDGAMLDIGFQNLSRLLASGKPLKVVVLDTQVYSNTGGQACTSGFLGQVSDMAAWGQAQHGKREQRKELALIAIAHRGAFVLQSSQASPGHLLGGVLRGLASRRPAVFNLYTPCQGEHAIPDSGSARAARLALESRAFPFVEYDPDRGRTLASRLRLDGNPASKEAWPRYKLTGNDSTGQPRTLELPLTTADWAATEPRFERHFRPLGDDELPVAVPFHTYLEMDEAERDGRVPFIWTCDRNGELGRLAASREMVALSEDRQSFWSLLREMAGQ